MSEKHDRGNGMKRVLQAGLVLLALTTAAAAQPAQPAKSETEHLVPPQGGAVTSPCTSAPSACSRSRRS